LDQGIAKNKRVYYAPPSLCPVCASEEKALKLTGTRTGRFDSSIQNDSNTGSYLSSDDDYGSPLVDAAADVASSIAVNIPDTPSFDGVSGGDSSGGGPSSDW
jgi:hypothetical protein